MVFGGKRLGSTRLEASHQAQGLLAPRPLTLGLLDSPEPLRALEDELGIPACETLDQTREAGVEAQVARRQGVEVTQRQDVGQVLGHTETTDQAHELGLQVELFLDAQLGDEARHANRTQLRLEGVVAEQHQSAAPQVGLGACHVLHEAGDPGAQCLGLRVPALDEATHGPHRRKAQPHRQLDGRRRAACIPGDKPDQVQEAGRGRDARQDPDGHHARCRLGGIVEG